jgi:hypothetical protein
MIVIHNALFKVFYIVIFQVSHENYLEPFYYSMRIEYRTRQ